MTNEPWTLQDVVRADLGKVLVWASASVAERVKGLLPFPSGDPAAPLPADLDTLIAVGGGTLIDKAKRAAEASPRPVKVVAIPSIWGSGAEVSPVAVVNDDGRKSIKVGPEFVPYAHVLVLELASTIPAARAVIACGDAWSHALEGFLSPLATPALRLELAGIMRTMLQLPLGNDPHWFAPSAAACAAQARSSVGLVHGIAHTLEGPLHRLTSDIDWGHAKLCSTFLYPVMLLNRKALVAWPQLVAMIADEKSIMDVLEKLFDRNAFAAALPTLRETWVQVLRDPCTRTNCVLVRREHIDHFTTDV